MADPLPEFPFVFVNGDIPDADHFMDNYEHVRDYLNARIGTLSDKQILVANASGQVVGRLVSGDATLSNTGALTIANNAITAPKIAADAVTNAKLADNAVDTAELKDSSVTTPKIGAGVINSSKFFPQAVNTAALADLAVTTAKLADLGVTGAKIAGGTIGSGKLALTTDSASLATTINPVPGSLTELCSVTVANGTWIVLAQAHLEPLTFATGTTRNAHLSLTYNGVEHETGDIVFTDVCPQTLNQVVTITSGTTLKLKVTDVGGPDFKAVAGDLTRLEVVRIN